MSDVRSVHVMWSPESLFLHEWGSLVHKDPHEQGNEGRDEDQYDDENDGKSIRIHVQRVTVSERALLRVTVTC